MHTHAHICMHPPPWWAHGVVVSMFDLNRSERGLKHSRGCKISCLRLHYSAAPLASV